MSNLLSNVRERFTMYKLPTLSAIFGTPLAFLLGEWSPLLSWLCVAIALDIITGFCKGLIDKRLRSRKMSEGMIRKAMIFVVIIIANMADSSLSPSLGAVSPELAGLPVMRTGVIIFYLVMELTSISENLGQMGVKLPKFLTDYLEVLRQKNEIGQAPVKEVEQIVVKEENGDETVLKTKK